MDFDTGRVTEDLTLYAHWNALPAEGEGFVRSGESRDGIAIDARRAGEKKESILPIASRYFGDPSPEASGKKAKRSCFAFFCGGR